jgi:hypothetical protein
MTDRERDPRVKTPATEDPTDDAHGETPEAQRQTVRGEQGTSSGDPHDDTDPQSG